MNRVLLASGALSLAALALGQARNAHWVYQFDVHVHFTPNGPQVQSTPYCSDASISHATISDTAGTLLFYTSGGINSVRAADGTTMTGSSAQNFPDLLRCNIAIPRPGWPGQYVLVATSSYPGMADNVLGHSLLDMIENGGQGAVISDQYTILEDSLIWPVAITPHANGTDYWVVTHELGTDAFRAYVIGSALWGQDPVISHAGSTNTGYWAFTSDLRFSYDGRYLASAHQEAMELFTFNDTTGQISHVFTDPGNFQTLEFSQDRGFLYAIDGTIPVQHLYQYDLTVLDSATIAGSKYSALSVEFNPFADMFLTRLRSAPDGRIYFNNYDEFGDSSFLCRIANPGSSGPACDVQYLWMDVAPGIYFSATGVDQPRRYHDSQYEGAPSGWGPVREADQFSLWPNPASGQAHVLVPADAMKSDLRVLDATGRTVRAFAHLAPGMRTIDLHGLVPGLYTILFERGGSITGQAKLVID